ncbi:YncE family protein [Corallococcus sp. RDP092CA]|uniref:YncE family protein n=1 Tax=Corallococcus sp. RDP092CA TaxID=3109369 RepID=UPI0035B2D61C
MRLHFLTPALLLLGACSIESEPNPPPSTRFVYPSGVAFWRPPSAGGPSASNGYLFVANANFDNCYDSGSVVALNLDTLSTQQDGQAVALPHLGGALPESSLAFEDLASSDEALVQIRSFAGELGLWVNPATGLPRLFVPSRAEGNNLHAVDVGLTASGAPTLTCVQGGVDCRNGALSLTDDIPSSLSEEGRSGLPRAPSPIGVTVDDASGTLYVTHSEAADSPAKSSTNFENYLATVKLDNPTRDTLGFIPLSPEGYAYGGSDSVTVGAGYLYVTGRNFVAGVSGTVAANFVLRLVDKNQPGTLLEPSLQSVYRIREARAVRVVPRPVTAAELAADPNFVRERLYLLARGPDTLLTIDFEYDAVPGGAASQPYFRVVSAVPMPDGVSDMQLISRTPGTSNADTNIIAVTSTGDSAVSFYDEALGQVVAQVPLVNDLNQGSNPSQAFGLTVDNPAGTNAARLFVTNFGDSQVSIVDIPDLARPQDARLVAKLGIQQQRDPNQGTSVCQEN